MPEKKRNQYAFDKEKYDHMHLQLPKGQKSVIQSHAQQRGESLNGFVNRAIVETMERDGERKEGEENP
jgi:hypothetical protein